jgi:asparagine synthase (glutamine-hydrolysing)
MCGIAGIALRNEPIGAEQAAVLNAAVKSLRHRGPDASGYCFHEQVGLGHARLSVLDLTHAARQPMVSSCERFATTYNGECYNFLQVAEQLRLDDLRSRSDTEVVLRAFAQEGFRCLPRLNGMFAFAIHDRVNHELFLVRDRLGIKPLYYALDSRQLCFASELSGLLGLLGRVPPCHTPLLHQWLYYGNSLGANTLFQGVVQIPPGHCLRLRLDTWQSELRAYWTLAEQCRQPEPTERGADLVVLVRELLREAVHRQLVSDVPVGVFLSGGIDSSAIAAFAAEAGQSNIRTFCVGFDDPGLPDERPRARRVADSLGIEHHDLMIGGDSLEQVVTSLVAHHGAPFFDAGNIPLWLMSRAFASRAKVVLQGDGGDELFGGYRRYSSLHHSRLFHAASILANPLLRSLPESPRVQRARRYANAFIRRDASRTMALLLTLEGWDPAVLDGFGPTVRPVMETSNPLAHHFGVAAKFETIDIRRRMSMVDISVVLPDIYLQKVDRATMAHGVEARVPFLDNVLVDFMARVPGEVSMPGGQAKGLLKRALRGVVPDEVLSGRKTGFNVPFGRWLRGPLRKHFAEQLDALSQSSPGVIDVEVIRSWVAKDASGLVDLSSRLWKLYQLAVWANHYQIRF